MSDYIHPASLSAVNSFGGFVNVLDGMEQCKNCGTPLVEPNSKHGGPLYKYMTSPRPDGVIETKCPICKDWVELRNTRHMPHQGWEVLED
jgi:hypothetical protein